MYIYGCVHVHRSVAILFLALQLYIRNNDLALHVANYNNTMHSILDSMNTQVYETTGHSPYEMVFGHEEASCDHISW